MKRPGHISLRVNALICKSVRVANKIEKGE